LYRSDGTIVIDHHRGGAVAGEDLLGSWAETATKHTIIDFVNRVTGDGPERVPPEDRIATFDNDGTLWCEKPLPIQLAFILQRLAEMATADPSLRDRQPWRAAYTHDLSWLGQVITKHYAGDDSDVQVLMGGILASQAGQSVDEYADHAYRFVHQTRHPVNGRVYADCGYAPMIELLRYLEANDFTTYIASGGDRDFMRPFASDIYDIPPERVIGSSSALRYDSTSDQLAYLAEPDVFDDGPVKPVRIWSRVGRRPLLAGGNSNGDVPMLTFAGGPRPALRLLIDHDDPDREFSYRTGAEHALDQATQHGWTVVSVKSDWNTVYYDRRPLGSSR
jgi:phosphoglycolate phosphatase-like HAD superfamily hydrolase